MTNPAVLEDTRSRLAALLEAGAIDERAYGSEMRIESMAGMVLRRVAQQLGVPIERIIEDRPFIECHAHSRHDFTGSLVIVKEKAGVVTCQETCTRCRTIRYFRCESGDLSRQIGQYTYDHVAGYNFHGLASMLTTREFLGALRYLELRDRIAARELKLS